MRFFIVFLCLFRIPLFAQQQSYYPDPDTLVQRRLEEWQDMKFGLLMHWGAYSQWGIVESWSICPEDLSWASGGRKPGVAPGDYNAYRREYENLKSTFNPTQFDPQPWAAAAKEAGMKYVVFTTKHHDGFCMFDTKWTDYKISDPGCPFSSNPRKDVAKVIFDAFRNQNFWIGAYFSKPDWHSPYYWWPQFPPADRHCNYSIKKYPERWEKFIEYTQGQIDELMSNYGRMDILWLDGGWVRPYQESEVKDYLMEEYEGSRYARNPQSQDIRMGEIVQKARAKQPGLIVVDRAVTGPYQNYLTPEQHIPENGLPYPWETCMTMATSWSYVPNDKYKSSESLVETLVDIVSKGGNLLLNIGPTPQGTFDTAAYARLRDIGSWMKINSEAIYGTRRCKNCHEEDGIRYTCSKDGRTCYAFLYDFPKGPVSLKIMVAKPGTEITLLGSGKKLKWEQIYGELKIQVPEGLESLGRYVWVLKISDKQR